MIYPDSFEQKIAFDRIRQYLLNNCLCELGEQHVMEMKFSPGGEALENELEKTNEMRSILMYEEAFPTENFTDPSKILKTLKVEGIIPSLEDIVTLRKSLRTIKAILSYIKREEITEKYPLLSRESSLYTIFPALADSIDRVMDKQGRIKDSASLILKDTRDKIRKKSGQITRKINAILKSSREQGYTETDAEATIRNDRPVIPVNAANKRKLGGIIHGESATGKTVFVEPAAIVEINNEINELESIEKKEINKILLNLADSIRPYIPDLTENFAFMGYIDFLYAKARFAIHIKAILPIKNRTMKMEWHEAIHPLLELNFRQEGKKVVPLNLRLSEEERLLIISGPNAGGKSVCLKTCGLLQYMFQCGLLVPMLENSEMCFFDRIFLDIGDDQSLDNDLSTYSSHLTHMKAFIKYTNEASLVLIDEFGVGTEPVIGGAIAESVLEKINENKSYGLITTHYSNIKHFASENEGVINGAMLFDTQKIEPLYQLVIGRPGNSFAIDLARKTGLPETVLENASKKVGKDYMNLEKYLREIIRDKKYWHNKRDRIKKAERKLDSLYSNYTEELNNFQKEKKKILKEAKNEANAIVETANKKIENTIRKIKESNADKTTTRKVREELDAFSRKKIWEDFENDAIEKKIEEVEKAVEKLIEKSPSLKAKEKGKEKPVADKLDEPEVGDKVQIKGIESKGEIHEIFGNKIIVAYGTMKTTVPMGHIEKIEKQSPKAKKSIKTKTITTNIDQRKFSFKPEIDVRGNRAEEALNKVQSLIDDAAMVSAKSLRVLHGKGNGILRQVIRDYLREMPLVKNVKDEHADHGGTGISIIELDI